MKHSSKKNFQDEKETMKEDMVEKVDSYLNYVVEEWMKENELAVERGIRTEIAEDFITGLKEFSKNIILMFQKKNITC